LKILRKNKGDTMQNETIVNNPDPKNGFQCHHIFPDGFRCGSPRMRDEQFCYFHHDSRRPVVRPHERIARRSSFSLFTPTSHNAIQESLGELLVRIATNNIDSRRAGLLLYCLQIASANLRTAQKAQQAQASLDPAPGFDEEPELEEELEHVQTRRATEGPINPPPEA
jgi:hypothetical protein